MGLKIAFVVALSSILTGCMAKKGAIKETPKYWFECCDPGINAAQKDMCKWLVEKDANALRDMEGNLYQAVWSDCEKGKEPWRKWED